MRHLISMVAAEEDAKLESKYHHENLYCLYEAFMTRIRESNHCTLQSWQAYLKTWNFESAPVRDADHPKQYRAFTISKSIVLECLRRELKRPQLTFEDLGDAVIDLQ